jgi:hypothetical protein
MRNYTEQQLKENYEKFLAFIRKPTGTNGEVITYVFRR